MSESVGNRYLVIIGALLVQLCLGSIYAWSFFQTALRGGAYTWTALLTQLPFAAGLASFALFMIACWPQKGCYHRWYPARSWIYPRISC
ncbi:MAG: hypothetical protein ACXAEJ_13355 [Candidatus Thorarchaeota archaeon]